MYGIFPILHPLQSRCLTPDLIFVASSEALGQSCRRQQALALRVNCYVSRRCGYRTLLKVIEIGCLAASKVGSSWSASRALSSHQYLCDFIWVFRTEGLLVREKRSRDSRSLRRILLNHLLHVEHPRKQMGTCYGRKAMSKRTPGRKWPY